MFSTEKPVDDRPAGSFPPYYPPKGTQSNPNQGRSGAQGPQGQPGTQGPSGQRGLQGPQGQSGSQGQGQTPTGNGSEEEPERRWGGRGGSSSSGERGEPGHRGEAGTPAGDVDPGDDRTGVANPNPGANNGFASSSTTEKPNTASIQSAPAPQGHPEPPPGGLPEIDGPALQPPPTGGSQDPGTLGYHPPTNWEATVTSTQRLTTPTEGLPPRVYPARPTPTRASVNPEGTPTSTLSSTQSPPTTSTEPLMDDAMVKRIEARQENLRSILIWLILVLFAVGIVLIVGAFAIYKGWCCKYDIEAKTQNNFCLRMCCKMDESYPDEDTRRNSPQEILQMDEIRNEDRSRDAQSEAEATEDEREQSEDDSDDRHHSNRRRQRGSRSRRNQNRTTGEVTQIFIIPQGFEPPPTYEESIGLHSNANEGQGQGQTAEDQRSSPEVSTRGGSSERVNSSSLPVSAVGPHVTRLNTLPTYEDSIASSGITISQEQLSQLTQGGSIPARARVFMLRSENRSQTVASSRYHSRPAIPGNLVGREHVTSARRDRRSPHRNRRSPAANEETNSNRSNRSTPRSTRSNRSNRSNRSQNRDRDSPRRSHDRTPPSTTSRSRERSNARDENQRSNRSQRSPSAHSRRSQSASLTGSPSGSHGPTLQVFNRRASDSSTDIDQLDDRPPRYTPHPTPRDTPREGRRSSPHLPRSTPRSTPREVRRSSPHPPRPTPHSTPRNTPRESRRSSPHPPRSTPRSTPRAPRGGATSSSDTTDHSHESFTATSDANEQVHVVTNSNTVLSSAENADHANVVYVASNNGSSSTDSAHAQEREPEVSQTSTSDSTSDQPRSRSRRNYQRGVSSASEFSELSRFSSRESDTFSTDSLESVGCAVSIVHISPSAANIPPPANMTNMAAVPSHRRLPSSQSNSSGLSTNHDAVVMAVTRDVNNAIAASESPRRLSHSSPATRTSVSFSPSTEEIQPIRDSVTSSSTGNSSSAEQRESASGSAENTQDNNNTNNTQASSPKHQAPPVPPPKASPGEWVTHVPTPDGSPALSRGAEDAPSSPSDSRIVVAIEPGSACHQRQHSDAVSIGALSFMTRQSERNSISGYSAHFDAVTLSSVVYVTSDNASLSDAASIGSWQRDVTCAKDSIGS